MRNIIIVQARTVVRFWGVKKAKWIFSGARLLFLLYV